MTDLPELEQPENGPVDDLDHDTPDHMETFRAPDLDLDGGDADDVVTVDPATGEAPQPPVSVDLIGKPAFYTVFKTAFAVPGMVVADLKPIAIQPDEAEIAREASDAVYELLEIYYPSALMPQSEGFARVMRMFPFVAAKVMVVREILTARRMARIEAANAARRGAPGPEFRSTRAAPEPANTDAPPQSSVFGFMDAEQAV